MPPIVEPLAKVERVLPRAQAVMVWEFLAVEENVLFPLEQRAAVGDGPVPIVDIAPLTRATLLVVSILADPLRGIASDGVPARIEAIPLTRCRDEGPRPQDVDLGPALQELAVASGELALEPVALFLE